MAILVVSKIVKIIKIVEFEIECVNSINYDLGCPPAIIDTCVTKQKHSMCISDYMQTTVFNLGRFLKKLADDRCSSITKGSIYHIKPMFIQPFTMDID